MVEQQESLWRVIAAPLLWAAHFLLCYVTAAIWCEKLGGVASFTQVRWAIGVYTAVALAGIAAIGRGGWKRHTQGRADASHGTDSAVSRHRFLGFTTVLLAALSALAVIYQTLPALLIGSCQ